MCCPLYTNYLEPYPSQKQQLADPKQGFDRKGTPF